MSHSFKIISAISIIAVIIIAIGLLTHRALDFSSRELEKSILAIDKAASAGDWSTAERNLEQVRSKWTSISGIWSMLIDHQEIDNIEFTLSRMEKFIFARDRASSLAETSALMNYVKHIPSKESLSLGNIF